ncbi:HNH endonuclease [Jatrophihabitans fulvus]
MDGPFDTAALPGVRAALGSMVPVLDAADRIERIRQLQQLRASLDAQLMTLAVAHQDQRRVEDATRGVPPQRQGAGAAGEVALARRMSPNQADRWLQLARVLITEMPSTFASLLAGRTTERRAAAMVRETVYLSRDDRAYVDRALAERLESLGDRAVEREARALAQQLDPAGAAERARRASRERRVTVRPAPDVMSWVTLLLPVAQGVAVRAALQKAADELIGRGAQGSNDDGSAKTRDQVMADLAVERLTGQTSAAAVPVEIELVMPADTLLNNGDQPGHVPGFGPVPAPLARAIAFAGGDGKVARWLRRLYTSPDGRRLVAMDSARRRFDHGLAHFIELRDLGTCRTPWCDAPIRHLDHVERVADGGATSAANGQGLCERCNYIKETFGWAALARHDGTVTTVTPTGHRYDSAEPCRGSTPVRTTLRWMPVVHYDAGEHHAA